MPGGPSGSGLNNRKRKIKLKITWNAYKHYLHYVQILSRRHYSSRNFGRLKTRPTCAVSTDAKVVSTGAGGSGSVDGLRGS